MISRLTSAVAILAVLAAASMTFAADTPRDAAVIRSATKEPVVHLERVVVHAKRLPAQER